MIKFLITILLAGTICRQMSAQTLTGTVYSSDKTPLAYASVTAIPVGGTAIEAFAQTDAKGNYLLNLKRTGEWQLTFSSMSFKNTLHTSMPIKIQSEWKTSFCNRHLSPCKK